MKILAKIWISLMILIVVSLLAICIWSYPLLLVFLLVNLLNVSAIDYLERNKT